MFELFKTFETQWYNDPASGSDEVLVTLDKVRNSVTVYMYCKIHCTILTQVTVVIVPYVP